MNAEKARQLSLQIKHKLITEKELIWLTISNNIFIQIKSDIINGKNNTVINLKDEIYSMINNLDFLEDKLKSEGYEVNFLFEKYPDGKRELIIKW